MSISTSNRDRTKYARSPHSAIQISHPFVLQESGAMSQTSKTNDNRAIDTNELLSALAKTIAELTFDSDAAQRKAWWKIL
jgi:hypothetical protein